MRCGVICRTNSNGFGRSIVVAISICASFLCSVQEHLSRSSTSRNSNVIPSINCKSTSTSNLITTIYIIVQTCSRNIKVWRKFSSSSSKVDDTLRSRNTVQFNPALNREITCTKTKFSRSWDCDIFINRNCTNINCDRCCSYCRDIACRTSSGISRTRICLIGSVIILSTCEDYTVICNGNTI